VTLLEGEPPPAPDEQGGEDGPVTLVLSRQARPGREREFEQVLRGLAEEVRRQPGHLAVAVLAPQAGDPAIYTIVSHFASPAAAQAWLDSPARARRVAEADLYAAGELQTRYLSGLEGWLARPGRPVLVPPARWRIVIVSAIAILPVLEAVTYLLAPRLTGLPVWFRPAVSAVLVIPVMQYAVMPLMTWAARGFLYPARRRPVTRA
jgi:antibiotic biosynthesis monooxygenase (ABM) superfamily enzyme